jgi:glycosyltransferase involved in cell wall biosynthesis
VRFLGQILPSELAEFYAAVDILVLASSHEGWPNVLLEAMACGTPVVASSVDGTPEVVTDAVAGLLVGERSGPAFAAAIARLFQALPDRGRTRAYAERFSWQATTEGQLALFGQIIAAAANARPS